MYRIRSSKPPKTGRRPLEMCLKVSSRFKVHKVKDQDEGFVFVKTKILQETQQCL